MFNMQQKQKRLVSNTFNIITSNFSKYSSQSTQLVYHIPYHSAYRLMSCYRKITFYLENLVFKNVFIFIFGELED